MSFAERERKTVVVRRGEAGALPPKLGTGTTTEGGGRNWMKEREREKTASHST